MPFDASATNPTSPLAETSDLTLSGALPVAWAIALIIIPSPTPSSMPRGRNSCNINNPKYKD